MDEQINFVKPLKFFNRLKTVSSEKEKIVSGQTPGMFKILEYLYRGYHTAEVIDFDSFSIGDLTYVFEAAHSIQSDEDIHYFDQSGNQEDERPHNRNNPFFEYLLATNSISSLVRFKKKEYPPIDDFI